LLLIFLDINVAAPLTAIVCHTHEQDKVSDNMTTEYIYCTSYTHLP